MIMFLNSIKPAKNSNKTKLRVGRGIGSGFGKTCGRGHKGQKSRSGGFHKVGFEGGQMPIQRRLPKRGFVTRKSELTIQVKLSELKKIANSEEININFLKKMKIISSKIKNVKIFEPIQLDKKLNIVGIKTTLSVKEAIEAAGGAVI